jgi:osmotically-inducible protein OsmY
MESFRSRAIAELVQEHLMGDQRLAGQMIVVCAANGHIEITGCVDTEEHKQLALALARGVPGVRSVEDHIKVRKPATPFSEVCE